MCPSLDAGVESHGRGEELTVGSALTLAKASLRASGVPEAALEAAVLLASSIKQTRAWVITHANTPLTATVLTCFLAMVERRCRREPTAYILGEKQWLDITLRVDRNVLIPRPETELLAEEAVAALRELTRTLEHAPRTADVGTGSGALAIAMARFAPKAQIIAVDNSAPALRVARSNAERLGAGAIDFVLGSLLDADISPRDLVVANLPYVPTGDIGKLEPELAYEPTGALDGGLDGLDLIRALLRQTKRSLAPGGRLLLECGTGQSANIAQEVRDCWPDAQIRIRLDYAGIDRIVVAEIE
jgi:release factor glutamine methyltransferase